LIQPFDEFVIELDKHFPSSHDHMLYHMDTCHGTSGPRSAGRRAWALASLTA
jgi:hypothetical protein